MNEEEEVLAFVHSELGSVWALELLRLLRQNRDRSLTASEMVAGLRGSDLVVAQSVESLVAAGLIVVETDGAARYRPASADLDKLSAEAEALYAKSPDAVRRAIVAAANPGISAFADAFRLRKD